MSILLEHQSQFETLLGTSFPSLQPIKKWNQTMWHNDGDIIVSLIFLSKKMKFCFFNNPDLELDKLQRWSATIYSQNLEFSYEDSVNFDRIKSLIEDTIHSQYQSI